MSCCLHLALEAGFEVPQSLAFALTQTVGVRRSDPLLESVQHLLVTSSSLSLSIDTCLTLGQLDFEDLLLVENEVSRSMLTLAFHTAKIHAPHALQQTSHRFNHDIVGSPGHLGVEVGLEEITVWIEFDQGEETLLAVREVLLEQVDAALLVPGVEQVDDAVAHPLDSRRLEAGLELDT